MRHSWLVLSMMLIAAGAQAQSGAGAAPKLLVVISVDQFSADLFAEYRGVFSSGLRRLQAGAVFPSGFQSHAATETCPGHATILTGDHPYRTGIIANDWMDASVNRSDKRVYCAEDPSVPDSSSRHYTASAVNLRVPTLGERMKAANRNTRLVSVAGKDRAAIMLGGHAIDQVWFWSGSAFVTLKTATAAAPAVVGQVNARAAASMASPKSFAVPAVCTARARAFPLPGKTLGIPQTAKAGDPGAYRTSLQFDRDVTDLAIGLIEEMKLGQGPAVDLLSIGLSATDYVGHTFGTQGAEMCAQLMGVDENVGRILDALERLHTPYAVVLTADHGAEDLPERSRTMGIADAARVDASLLPENMNRAIEAQLHVAGALLPGEPSGDVYLSGAVPADARLRTLQAAQRLYAAHPQVAAAFITAELARQPLPHGPVDEWTLAERFRVDIDRTRSGDLLVALKPHITPVPTSQGAVVTHGSPWNYDRRVPILFFMPGAPGFEQPLPVQTVDILPTLAALISLPVPAGEIDGHCLPIEGWGTCPH